ncbi:MAG: helix-turn-helix domain-containing protein [bacterium]|nr:helix-turn-helix domain-containing protein [bacterium]
MKERLHTIILSLDGYTSGEIARLIKRDEKTIRKWIHTFNKHGLKGLERKSLPGRPSKLQKPHR